VPATKWQQPEHQAPAEPKTKATDEFHRFCADCLEEGSTFTINPMPAFELWKDWCSRRTIAHGSQKRFGGMMGERFKRDANNGYPRYIGVRAKPVATTLRVVSSH
jgi:phage/plasmid-associated DNA primase